MKKKKKKTKKMIRTIKGWFKKKWSIQMRLYPHYVDLGKRS
jgi:hypothetical protein